ncbi:ChaN family lipoprotein [Calothrix sp. UHCC 0171]|uniref:ChaN family lipoprotein n=1 Tax=Calothrix sp. UHCC 0171 TaxID=3110245 RepID=UPI002B2140F0|nr:ChaN family lipoprotein [Calothrix sp. UHCC 0171]MEA5569998.1 ChaN family lipoprotein [Calothrix sp. UHCC 0171]
MRLFALSLGFLVFCTLPACAQTQAAKSCETRFASSKCVNNVTQLAGEISKARVIYLGETHDSAEDHARQLQIIQALSNRKVNSNKKIAIALEMFQRPYQDVLNNYLAGKITEAELVKQTEYEQRWGFPWELYAPIIRFAKANNIPLIATNTPTEITRKVSRQGLESLTPEERKLVPPFSEIRTAPEEYRKLVLAAFEGHQNSGHGNSKNQERFFLAQVLWDETMAESIANFVQKNPDYQVIVLAGQGHIVYDYGIPSRVQRRLQGKTNMRNFTQLSVLLSPPEDDNLPQDKKIADYIWGK